MRMRYHDIYEAFFRNVIARAGCWGWRGYTAEGYGQVQVNGEQLTAHRMSWEIYHSPIPDGMFVLHHCDDHICSNPDCLFLGTQADNIADMVGKRRHYKGIEHWKAVLCEDDVRAIRSLYASGVVQTTLASQFGVVQTQVSNIVCRKSWRHVV